MEVLRTKKRNGAWVVFKLKSKIESEDDQRGYLMLKIALSRVLKVSWENSRVNEKGEVEIKFYSFND